jgi:hypothetical protein
MIHQVGLCETCCFVREIKNRRGSSFLMCERSKQEAQYARYPRLPVKICAGYEKKEEIM